MLLMFSFLAVFSVSDINNTKAEQDSHFNVNLTMESGQKIEPALMEELKQLPHIEDVYKRQAIYYFEKGTAAAGGEEVFDRQRYSFLCRTAAV